MITRIEIDGFKSFEDFALDLAPLTVLAGANNSGKSNLLEALVLLRDLILIGTDEPLVNRPRGTGVELFHRADDGTRRDKFTISAELGPHGRASSWPPLLVDVGWRPGRNSNFAVGTGFEERSRSSLASWITVNPDPSVMRNGASLDDMQPLAGSGANLAAVIGRIFGSDCGEEFVLDAQFVVGDLVDIIPISDGRRNQWDFDLIMRGGRSFTPALVSDGTLRVLALLAALHDPDHKGVVLIEDLENGLHPEFQGRLCDRLAAQAIADERRQVIATTHSPVVVSATLDRPRSMVVFLDQVFGPSEKSDGIRRGRHRTRARQIATGGERGTYVTPMELENYLASAGGR
jgi:predicted ATPase